MNSTPMMVNLKDSKTCLLWIELKFPNWQNISSIQILKPSFADSTSDLQIDANKKNAATRRRPQSKNSSNSGEASAAKVSGNSFPITRIF